MDELFVNSHDMSSDIAAYGLVDGLVTRLVPGANALLTVLRIGPNKEAEVRSHPQEAWGMLQDKVVVFDRPAQFFLQRDVLPPLRHGA